MIHMQSGEAGITPRIFFHDGYPWISPEQFSFSRPIEIYCNTVEVSSSRLPKFLCLITEPKNIRDLIPSADNANIIRFHRRFSRVLTHDSELMSSCRNAVFMPLGSSYIHPDDRRGVEPKQFGVSFVCGSKRLLEGHHLRQRLWLRQQEIRIPHEFWISSRDPIPPVDRNPCLPEVSSAKSRVFRWQFHICVENCRIDNYFSEKLIDCLVTGTVPIYRGCPNIADFFDPRGMMFFQTEDEAINICNSLDESVFESMRPFIEVNRILAAEYARPVAERMQQVIQRELHRSLPHRDFWRLLW